jgi:hypothetical protein
MKELMPSKTHEEEIALCLVGLVSSPRLRRLLRNSSKKPLFFEVTVSRSYTLAVLRASRTTDVRRGFAPPGVARTVWAVPLVRAQSPNSV